MTTSATLGGDLTELETAVNAFLVKQDHLTPESIRERITKFRALFDVSDEDAEALAQRFEARHDVTMEIGEILRGEEHEPWLDAMQATIDPYYWTRYKELLQSKGFSNKVLAPLDEVTHRILGELGDPSSAGPWDRRGMVVGHVQSGKTANYTGLIAKAADAGYKLIVVIAGIHNNLRNQTQLRIDEGFVGRDSAKLLSKNKNTRAVGVGLFDSTRVPVTFTNSVRDFNKMTATGVGIPLQNLNEPAVFVIKKNPSTLKNLHEWLVEHSAKGGAVDVPMLLIDDEADNASINIRYGKDQASRINSQIRDILKTFRRSCYVGYTATPFANIFIDPDSDSEMVGADLFPKDFIVSLDPPTNYFGAGTVFLDRSEEIVRHIEDNGDCLPISHKKDDQISLPPSMIDAMRTFVVARAIRLVRGHENAHCSMLVNASRFTDVQSDIRNQLHARLEKIQANVRTFAALPEHEALQNREVSELHRIWHSEFQETGVTWSQVQGALLASVAPIRVVEVNSRASGTLDYANHEKTGLTVIAVGGFSLSRGLTLEGLMVSYFLRNSMMYDTLMQMGRWFGYRPDYDDLCRVWMPEDAEGWYAHIAESIELLRDELRTMAAAGATPREFGLKVRSHPESLMVTARNKMGSGEKVVVSVGLGNNFVETATLDKKPESLQQNRSAVDALGANLASLGFDANSAEQVSGGWLLRGVPVEPVLKYLKGFVNHPGSILTDPGPVSRYIEDRANGELKTWDLLIPSVKTTVEPALKSSFLGLEVNCQRRAEGTVRGSDSSRTLRVSNKQRVASRGIEKVGLSPKQVKDAEEYHRAHADRKPPEGKPINYPDHVYRKFRTRPLLIVHLLRIAKKDEPLDKDAQPVVAWGISFPETELTEKKVEYMVNTVWMRENFPDDGWDDEDAEAEDDE